MQEKKLLTDYFDQIAQDTGLYCFGVEDTLRGLDMGAVETLIMWESLSIMRHVVRNSQNEIVVIHCQSGEETTKAKDKFIDSATGTQMEAAEEPMLLVDWMAENYREFGTTLEVCVDLSLSFSGLNKNKIITNKSQEGTQFVRGFGGIGGKLRYKVDMQHLASLDDEDEVSSYLR